MERLADMVDVTSDGSVVIHVPSDFEGDVTACGVCGSPAPVRDSGAPICTACWIERVMSESVTLREACQLLAALDPICAQARYAIKDDAQPHTCWNQEGWDGCLTENCAGCIEAKRHPCAYCGYGHAFTTHNPEPHQLNGDIWFANGFTWKSDDDLDRWMDSPHVPVGGAGE